MNRGPLPLLRRAGLRLLDVYAAQQCMFCDQASGRREALCDTCLAEFRRNDRACPRCGLPECGRALCPACLAHPPPLARTVAPLVYDAAVAYLIKRWKFENDRNVAETAALLMAADMDAAMAADVVIPVPLHWRRRVARGFNQSEDLLAALRSRLPKLAEQPRRPGLALRRIRATPKQSLATRRARLGNLERAFRVQGDANGLSVTLLDDVCTTGATARAAARMLLRAGAREVNLWCLARTPTTALRGGVG